MDLDAFVKEVQQLKDERQVLAVKVVELEEDVKKAQTERDTLAKKLVEISDSHKVTMEKLDAIAQIVTTEIKKK